VSCLDRAPVSLGAGSDLDRIGKKPIYIATVETLELVLDIEILQKSSLIRDIVSSNYLRDPIEWERAGLIDRDTQIQEYSRNYHTQDKRHRYNLSDIHRGDLPKDEWSSIGGVLLLERLEKTYPILLKRKTVLARKSVILLSEVIVEGFDLGEDIADSVFHMIVLVASTDNHLRMTQYAVSESVSSLEFLDNLALFAWHLSHHIVTIWVDLGTE
jgi:hypothetical protein